MTHTTYYVTLFSFIYLYYEYPFVSLNVNIKCHFNIYPLTKYGQTPVKDILISTYR